MCRYNGGRELDFANKRSVFISSPALNLLEPHQNPTLMSNLGCPSSLLDAFPGSCFIPGHGWRVFCGFCLGPNESYVLPVLPAGVEVVVDLCMFEPSWECLGGLGNLPARVRSARQSRWKL